MSRSYQPLRQTPRWMKQRSQSAELMFWRLVIFVLGILVGALLIRRGGNRSPRPRPRTECTSTLPLDPILRHPVLPGDRRFVSAENELSKRLHGRLNGTDSAVVMVLHGGETVLEWSHGRIKSNESAQENDRKVGPDTIWRVASITKVFTVLEALIQQNEGRLNMDDDIREYVDEFRLFDNSENKLSLRQLGSHLSGLGRDIMTTELSHFPDLGDQSIQSKVEVRAPAFCDPGSTDRSNGSRMCTKDDILRAIASRPLAFEPWTRPLYSNTGFNLLGWASAEAYKRRAKASSDETPNAVASTTMEDLLQKDVFESLHMKDSSFLVSEEKKDRVAVPSVPNFVDWDFTSTFNPAGGMFTTGNDLAKFVHKVLLSPNSTILTNQQVREWLSPFYVFTDRKTAVGMPWEITLPSGIVTHPLFGKAGGHPGMTSYLLVSPDLSFAVLAFACGPQSNAGSLAFETARLISPLMQQALGERSIEAYAGIYQQDCPERCSDCGEIVVEVENEMKITRMVDCNGKDMFSRFEPKCSQEECMAKLWPVGREGEFRAQILFKEAGCEKVWFGFEPWVVKGWPIDLVRIGDDRIVYEPLGVDAKRLPLKDELNSEAEGKDGLLAWRVEAPFDMVW